MTLRDENYFFSRRFVDRGRDKIVFDSQDRVIQETDPKVVIWDEIVGKEEHPEEGNGRKFMETDPLFVIGDENNGKEEHPENSDIIYNFSPVYDEYEDEVWYLWVSGGDQKLSRHEESKKVMFENNGFIFSQHFKNLKDDYGDTDLSFELPLQSMLPVTTGFVRPLSLLVDEQKSIDENLIKINYMANGVSSKVPRVNTYFVEKVGQGLQMSNHIYILNGKFDIESFILSRPKIKCEQQNKKYGDHVYHGENYQNLKLRWGVKNGFKESQALFLVLEKDLIYISQVLKNMINQNPQKKGNIYGKNISIINYFGGDKIIINLFDVLKTRGRVFFEEGEREKDMEGPGNPIDLRPLLFNGVSLKPTRATCEDKFKEEFLTVLFAITLKKRRHGFPFDPGGYDLLLKLEDEFFEEGEYDAGASK